MSKRHIEAKKSVVRGTFLFCYSMADSTICVSHSLTDRVSSEYWVINIHFASSEDFVESDVMDAMLWDVGCDKVKMWQCENVRIFEIVW